MENVAPLEIIGAPATLWAAVASTAKPDIDDLTLTGWTKIGTSGDKNYTRDGVRIEHPQSLNHFRSAGDTAIRKSFRQEEDTKVHVTVADMTLEQYSRALNENTVTTTPASSGVAGSKSISLKRGPIVRPIAILVRWPSPAMEDGVSQCWLPRAVQTAASSGPSFKPGDPALLELEWTAQIDETQADADQLGALEVQTDEAES